MGCVPMVPKNASSRSELSKAIALRRSGRLALEAISPQEAAALWNEKLLSADDVAELANHWLEKDLDCGSIDLAALALNVPTDLSEVGQQFESALQEMKVPTPSNDDSILIVLNIYLCAIIEARLSPMAGMAFVDDLFFKHYGNASEISCKPLVRHPKREDGDTQNYLGQELGLEHLYTWYREFQDAEDMDGSTWYYTELPPLKQLEKFDEELIAEAETLQSHLREVYPLLFG